MRVGRPPKWVWLTLAGVVGLVLVLRLRDRRDARQAASAAVYAGYPIAPIPVSFSYLTDAASPPGGTVPAPGIDAASLGLITQLQNALVSNAALIAGRVPRSVGVSSSTSSLGVHPLITSASGDTAGRPGENRWYATTPQELAAKGGTWALHAGWQGPGVYEAQKFTDPYNAGTTGTEIVKVA